MIPKNSFDIASEQWKTTIVILVGVKDQITKHFTLECRFDWHLLLRNGLGWPSYLGTSAPAVTTACSSGRNRGRRRVQ